MNQSRLTSEVGGRTTFNPDSASVVAFPVDALLRVRIASARLLTRHVASRDRYAMAQLH